jgi:cysteine desulfurase
VAVMAVNNETGAVQDIAGIARAVAGAAAAFGRAPPRLHCDAVQALGKVELDLAAAGASSIAFSAHKVRGPRGVGALWTSAAVEPLALGGGQEGGLRPGTESLLGAWAFAAAAESARSGFAQRAERARALEARLLSGVPALGGALALPLGRAPGDGRYSPFIVSVAFPGLSGEVLARSLSDEGVAVSAGSACSSNSRRAGGRVLRAMGLGEDLSLSSVRVSTGDSTAEADIDRFLEAASLAYRRLKA